MRSALALILIAACQGGSPAPGAGASKPATPAPAPASPAPGPPAPEAQGQPTERFELPEVEPAGYEAAIEGPTVAASLHGIVVDGQLLVSLTDGIVDPAEKEGGVQGIKIPKLTTFLGKRRAAGPEAADPQLVLALDRRLPYRLLIEVLYSAKLPDAGFRRFRIAARAGGRDVQLPIKLPEPSPARLVVGPGYRGPRPLGMIVSIAKDRILVWSFSGLEGTLKQPLATIDPRRSTAAAEVGRALAGIVQRRWAGKPRPAEDRELVVQADSQTPMQRIAEILGAVRAAPDGAELFPDVLLSTGFE